MMAKCFAVALLMQMSIVAASDEVCTGSNCATEDADDLSMLQTKLVTDADPDDSHVDPGHPGSELEEDSEITARASKAWEKYNRLTVAEARALVPKDLAPMSMQEILRLNASSDAEVALLSSREDNGRYAPVFDVNKYPHTYCSHKNQHGQITRTDVGAAVGADLTIDLCYLFSCQQPFQVSSSCVTFYTNGGGNCKCCHGAASYYVSSMNNVVYHC